jgi:hypothetical protein
MPRVARVERAAMRAFESPARATQASVRREQQPKQAPTTTTDSVPVVIPPRKGKSSKRGSKPRSRVLRRLGQDDQLVEYFKPVEKPAWMSAEQWATLPQSIPLREIRRSMQRDGHRAITVTVVTTLLDAAAYPADDVIELRLTRWMIETNLRHLKITLKMDELKCKTLDGVRKERAVFLLVYNLVRLIMLRCAWRQGVNINRLSFADTLAWLRHGDINAWAKIKINPLRPGRLQPRVRKRPKKQFPYMNCRAMN